MDDYHVADLSGSDICKKETLHNQPTAVENLRRKVRIMHAKHVLDWLFRAAALGGLIVVGYRVLETTWGSVLAITAGFLLVHTLLYCINGHWRISQFCKARMYWLQDSAVDQDVSPVYLHSEAADLTKKTA